MPMQEKQHSTVDPDSVSVLEMDRLLAWVAEYASSAEAQRALRETEYSLSRSWIQAELRLVAELAEIHEHRGGFGFSALADAMDPMRHLLDGADWLNGRELNAIASFLELCRRVREFADREETGFPALFEAVEGLQAFPEAEARIRRQIGEDGELKDSASPDLGRLRHGLKREENRLRSELERVEQKLRQQGLLGDTGMTWREGHPVLPVPAGNAGRVQGLVVDQSQTGRTLFVEPMISLEIHGKINRLRIELHQEEARLLRELSDTLRQHHHELDQASRRLVRLDSVSAKAVWGRSLDAIPPEVSSDLNLRIVRGRHPLLMRHLDVVPLDLQMGGDTRVLLISGPNAGGKTVAMKTVGLFALMLRAGLPLPCEKGTRIPVFETILTDIGDQQSIENDLSTYSSHVLRMKRIVSQIQRSGLFLVDELGNGTDPEEGSAVAMAFLERMLQSRGLTIASSHLGQLKAFAHDSEGIDNASMSFDEEQILPTFRLIQGVPGASYAVEILQRMEMPKVILDRARHYLGSEQKNLARLIARMQSSLAAAERSRRNVEAREIEVESLTAQYRERMKSVRKEARELKRQALQEAGGIVAGANRLVEQAVREIREEQGAPVTVQAVRGRLQEQRDTIEKRERKLKPREERRKAVSGIKVGDLVRLKDIETPARVTDIDRNGKKLRVEAGVLKLMVSREQVEEIVPEQQQPKRISTGGVDVQIADARLRLDLRGMTADEAMGAVDRYLDECLVAGLGEVTILHGKGTGVLRGVVREHLGRFHFVRGFRDGHQEEGGDGVTVVRLDV